MSSWFALPTPTRCPLAMPVGQTSAPIVPILGVQFLIGIAVAGCLVRGDCSGATLQVGYLLAGGEPGRQVGGQGRRVGALGAHDGA